MILYLDSSALVKLALEALAEFERRLLSAIEARVTCDLPEWA